MECKSSLRFLAGTVFSFTSLDPWHFVYIFLYLT